MAKKKKHAFVLKDQPTIVVSADGAAEYNRKVAAWCKKRGLLAPVTIDDGTNTLSPESTTAITNTVNSDDHVDTFTDQVVDDSGD